MIVQIAQFIETARQRLLDTSGDFLKSSSRKMAESWLDNTQNEAIQDAIKFASARTGLEHPEIFEQTEASLRFRVLAGTISLPVEVPEDEPRGCVCANQEYDPKMDAWPCKVSNNQAQADAFHEKFGNGPACPFWENPNPKVEREDELHKLLNDGEELYDAWKKLRLTSPTERLPHVKD